jgi:hypothetical protein
VSHRKRSLHNRDDGLWSNPPMVSQLSGLAPEFRKVYETWRGQLSRKNRGRTTQKEVQVTDSFSAAKRRKKWKVSKERHAKSSVQKKASSSKQFKPSAMTTTRPPIPSALKGKLSHPQLNPLLAWMCSSGFVSSDASYFDELFNDPLGRA